MVSTMPPISSLPEELTHQIIKYINFKSETVNFADLKICPLTPDGSDRIYYRISYPDDTSFIAVDASGTGLNGKHSSRLSQNQTFILIRDHLDKLDFPVPELLSKSQHSDYYLLQDLGDYTLYKTIKEQGWNSKTLELYRDSLSLLLNLQNVARNGFDPVWCYAGAYYDRQLILEYELNYFLNSFLIGYCGLKISQDNRLKLEDEFINILNAATSAPADFFLYRDFQSKNLMLLNKQIFLIDFQGARLGPYYYDLAALINDPYTDIPWHLRDQFCSYYFDRLKLLLRNDAPSQKTFSYFFSLFSLIRTLQTLGAFGYLTINKKEHFKTFINPALKNLHHYLNKLSDHINLHTLTSLIQNLSVVRLGICM